MDMIVIRSKENLDDSLHLLGQRLKSFWNWDQHEGIEIVYRPLKSRRTLSQNDLYWQWMEDLSVYFTRNGRPLTKDDAHDLMRHIHLGYTSKTIGKTEIGPFLRSTKTLSTAEMGEYMDRVDAWAIDMGCQLPTPADSAHERYLKKSQKR
jgi:hypothetical protein